VRVILKHPFDRPEIVADYERTGSRLCAWQPCGTPRDDETEHVVTEASVPEGATP